MSEAAFEEEVIVEPEPEAQPEPEPAIDVQAEVDRAIQARDSQWMAHNESQKAQPPSDHQRHAEPEPSNDYTTEIDNLYTNDETGHRTKDAIDKHFKLLIKSMGLESNLTEDQVRNIASSESGLVRDQIRTGLAITQEVQDLVARGLIADEEAGLVQSAYSKAISAPGMKDAGSNPANAPYILKSVFYDMVKDGKLKPGAPRRRPSNPMQPGGNGAPASAPEAIDPSTSPFQSVRNMDKNKLSSVREASKENYARANRG